MAEDFPRNGGDSPLEPTIGPLTMSPSILKWGAVIIGLIVVFGIVSFGRGIYTDLLWFDSLGFRSIFLTVTVTRLALFAIGALTTAVILGVSLRLAHLHSAGEVNLPIPEEVVPTLRRAVLWGAVIVARDSELDLWIGARRQVGTLPEVCQLGAVQSGGPCLWAGPGILYI